jgi:hypothetical protein
MPDEAEIVTRRFRIERGPEGEVERVYVEGLVEAVNAKGRRRDADVLPRKGAETGCRGHETTAL